MTTVTQVLDLARSQIGTHESPAGSNNTKYGLWYGFNGVPWCAIFVSWVLHHSGVETYRFAAVASSVAHAKRNARWTAAPQVGYVCCKLYTSTTGHTGIVEAVHGDGTITTIEGNTSSADDRNGGIVMRRRRSVSFWNAGYIRVDYSSIQPPPVLGPVYGADVSHHQGPNLDFVSLKHSGVMYCWLKATEGTHFVDPQFANNMRKARAAGVIVGAYTFMRPGVDIAKAVGLFRQTVGPLQEGDLLPAMDIEVPGFSVAEIRAYRSGIAQAFGADPSAYIATALYQGGLNSAVNGCALWIPRYNTAPPVIPWDAWQYTDKRPAPGTSGIDGNITHRLRRLRFGLTDQPEDDMFTNDDSQRLLRVHDRLAGMELRLDEFMKQNEVQVVRDSDWPNEHKPIYIIGPMASWRIWIQDGNWLNALSIEYGFSMDSIEDWGRTSLDRIPLIGPEAPSAPTT